MSQIVEIDFNLPDFGAAAKEIRRSLPGLIAATLQLQRSMIFQTHGSYHGRRPWEPLKHRAGEPLRDRGTLSQSIGPMNDGLHPAKRKGSIVRLSNDIVTIGTDLAYARVQNDGATIKPKGGTYSSYTVRTAKSSRTRLVKIDRPRKRRMLRFWIALEGRYVFAKQVTIPARPFADITSDDVRNLQETVANYVSATIARLQ